jgi:integrase/recombinase XerD
MRRGLLRSNPGAIMASSELVPVGTRDLIRQEALSRDRHPAAVYLAHLAPGSRRTMREALTIIAGLLTSGRCTVETLAWDQLRYQHTAAIRAVLAERYQPATANKMLAALRGVLKEAWRLEQMSAEDYHRARDIPSVRGSALPSGRALSRGELRALFQACAQDASAAGRRDAALLAVLYGGGLRRSEATALDTADYDAETGALIVRSGKGHKDRTAYATNGAKDALDDWLAVRGVDPGPLFVPVDKAARLYLRRMTAQAILCILHKRAEEAGVKTFSPHDLRRTFISDLLDLGADISTVQRLAGHANVTTTARYDRRDEGTKRQASELLHVPYRV